MQLSIHSVVHLVNTVITTCTPSLGEYFTFIGHVRASEREGGSLVLRRLHQTPNPVVCCLGAPRGKGSLRIHSLHDL